MDFEWLYAPRIDKGRYFIILPSLSSQWNGFAILFHFYNFNIYHFHIVKKWNEKYIVCFDSSFIWTSNKNFDNITILLQKLSS